MSEWVEHRQQLPGGGSVWSRGRHVPLPGGLWWIEQRLRYRGRQRGAFPMGAGWIIEFIERTGGSMSFHHDGRKIPAPRRFVWVLPAFCVVRMESNNAAFRFVAVAGRDAGGDLPVLARPAHSQIFPLRGPLPKNAKELLKRLDSLDQGVSAEISTALPPMIGKAKRWLTQNYREKISVSALARALGVSHAHLTREFRRALGLSPLAYAHYLRSSEAASRLASGERIVDASLDVGYGDLSRFYKQFQKLGCSSPGTYKAK